MSKGSYSVFQKGSLEDIYEEIRGVYLADKRPWVVGYSGGKDSTTALQLVWNALKPLLPETRQKPVFVISSDTLVETPIIVNYIDTTLRRINEAAAKQGMPFKASKVTPVVEETFWVNLIGRGYPAPSNRFRWCTERMKIRPADRFIMEKVAEFGEVVVILGVRKGESTTRDQVLALRRIKNSLLSTHSTLPHAYVYTPIVDFTVDDVWQYLLQVPSPWGNNNRDLSAMYKSANAGECPLVVDTTTPSCGNSRFGCWVCTVVEKDKSMEALVDGGEEWLLPLLEFRDLLGETQDPAKKHLYRDYRRLDGKVWRTPDGDIVRGPYRLETCKDFLRRLLTIQQKVRRRKETADFVLISMDELQEIRRIWRAQRQDWDDSVPRIYREVTGEDCDWLRDDAPVYRENDSRLLADACKEAGASTELVASLLDMERDLHGMLRRSTVMTRMDKILRRDWDTEEEVVRRIEEEKRQRSGGSR